MDSPRHPTRAPALSVAWLATLAALSAGCPSGRSSRGVEHPNTQRPEAAGGERSPYPSCRGEHVDAVWAPPGFCVTRVATGLDLPRHLTFAPNGDILVATRAGVIVLWDANGDGQSGHDEFATLGGYDLDAHGVAVSPDGRYIYFAGSHAVRRIPYTPGLRANNGAGEVVIPDLPGTVDHPHRSITFDHDGRLYVQIGAADNLSQGPGAVIMRYALPAALPAGGVPFASGERYAYGLRNGEALAWDQEGRLWSFVNGRDFLRPPGTPEDFYFDHPGDWIYRLSPRPNTFYGFPFCWALGPAPWGDRHDPASQWADPDANGGHDDAWCHDAHNVFPAAGALPAHTAPLGAVQYTGTLFPAQYRGNFFVASHGSWNRQTQQRGRMLVRVAVDGDAVTAVEPFVGESDHGNLREGQWALRPVGVAQGPDGALYFTSDETGDVIRVGYGHE